MTQKSIIADICKELGIELKSLSHDYVFRLYSGGKTRHILGALWDINTAAADRIATDKCACYTIMDGQGVPAIPHLLLNNPLLRRAWQENTSATGVWAEALAYYNDFGKKVVLKPNQGSRGLDVYFCQNIPKMEAALHTILATNPAAAICPLIDIAAEYRVFFLDGVCHFTYGKKAGENGKHNLSQGATAFELADPQLTSQLYALAASAAQAINIKFATVDIAQTATGELSIMEINSGVQANQLIQQLPHLIPTIKKLYTHAVEIMFKG
ncbi:MAG: ATP-grasp domain-containing protein [Defluviitaleaceae bacterium]|nr:ATP-grasp domain-containing protein [Defluviitaleaceae bacterium]